MSFHNKHGLLGPQLLGLGAGLLSQGFTEMPQTGFEGLGRGLQFAQKFGQQAQQQQLRQQMLQNQVGQQDITNDFARQRIGLAQERLGIARAGAGQTSLLKNLAAADAADAAGNPAQAQAIRAAMSTPQTQVNIVNKARTAGGQELFKQTAADFVLAHKDASAAQARVAENAAIAAALSNPNLFTGTGGNVVQNLKEAAQALGFDVAGVADGQLMQVLGTKAALRLQQDMPLGKLTDRDVELLLSMTTSLNKTPETNRRLLLLNQLSDKLKIDRARIAREHLKDGVVSPQVYGAWARAEAVAVKQMKVHIQAMRAESAQLKSRSPLVGVRDISRMSREDIKAVDKSKASLNQLLKMQKRLERIKGAPDA